MRITNASPAQIRKACRTAECTISRSSMARDGRLTVALTPLGSKYTRLIFTGNGAKPAITQFNGAHALCWHGYWCFFKALFAIAPHASCRIKLPNKTSMTYNASNFDILAPPTGLLNVGSYYFNVPYNEACACHNMIEKENNATHNIVNGVCIKCDAGDPTSPFTLKGACPPV